MLSRSLHTLPVFVLVWAVVPTAAAGAPGVRYADEFDRGSLGADWVVDRLQFEIQDGALVETSAPRLEPAQLRFRGGAAGGSTGTPDQFAKIEIAPPLTTTPAGFLLRADDTSQPLGLHYEVHLRQGGTEWRWELYDPDFVTTLGSCAGSGLAAGDWLGATVEGSGPATRVSVWRWQSDPDTGDPADPEARWGPPDCVLGPAPSGAELAEGTYGGIRFWGGDPAASRADHWSFGALGPVCFADADCDDGVFCNGAERCGAGECVAGPAPCAPQDTCDEAGPVCTPPTPLAGYSDAFDRETLGPDWRIDRLDFAVANGELVETSPPRSEPAQMRWRGGANGGSTGTPDQYAKIRILAPLTSTPAGFLLRANDPSQALGLHDEVHLRQGGTEWRWELYDPDFVATLGSCAGSGLAAGDWLGATVTGVGLATRVEVWRWDDDPDAGAAADPAAHWGPPDCVLGPPPPLAELAEGTYGGIRFWGGDPAVSHADEWSFGALGGAPPGEAPPSVPPDDPFLPQLWALHNQGQTGGTAGADIGAFAAWQLSTGSRDVVVAVLDTGLDYRHEDLAANLWTNAGEIPGNGIDDDANGYVDDTIGWDFFEGDNDPFDDGGHGTHVAGIIGAVGDNGIGVVGVSPRVRIMPLKIEGANQVGRIDAAIAAIEYAVAMGARVISNSWAASGAWGEPGWDQPGFAPQLEAAIEAAGRAGVLFVATAGNAGEDKDERPIFPASFPAANIVAVAATDEDDRLAASSSFGLESIDLAAPGVAILSTVPEHCSILGPPPGPGTCDGSGYQIASGTSVATPHVAGVAALVLARYPGIPLAALKARLLYGSAPLPLLEGYVLSGGRLDAASALEDDVTAPAAVDDLLVLLSTSRSIYLLWHAPGDDGELGTARAYDLRLSTTPIDVLRFTDATPVRDLLPPLPAGSHELFEVRDLEPDTRYYFAVRAIDNVGNAGAVVSVAAGSTLPD